MKEAMLKLFEQALKAINGLYSTFSRLNFNVKTKLILFDRMISLILFYCSEVFCIYDTSAIDRLHVKFCKKKSRC